MQSVAVIIPTTCELARADMLKRAVSSCIDDQPHVDVQVIVVANGSNVLDSLLWDLAAMPQVRVLRLTEGNVSAARYAGLNATSAEYFSFLDDDDTLLPGALRLRLEAIGDAGAVVTNGYYHHDGKDAPLVPARIVAQVNADPLGTLLESNWFASPSTLFRRASVPVELFDFKIKFFEWTYMLFCLVSAGIKIRFTNEMTYWKNEDNPLSVSKAADYAAAEPAFLASLLQFELPPAVARKLQRRRASALNAASNAARAKGWLLDAWSLHLKCLIEGGWRFLPYTRRLVF